MSSINVIETENKKHYTPNIFSNKYFNVPFFSNKYFNECIQTFTPYSSVDGYTLPLPNSLSVLWVKILLFCPTDEVSVLGLALRLT